MGRAVSVQGSTLDVSGSRLAHFTLESLVHIRRKKAKHGPVGVLLDGSPKLALAGTLVFPKCVCVCVGVGALTPTIQQTARFFNM